MRIAHWSGFGNYNSSKGEALTATQAVEKTGLDWNVYRLPAYTKIGDKFVEVPHRNFTVRMDNEEVFDAVGPDYHVIQNKEGVQFLNDLVDSNELIIETALELKGGKSIAVVARKPENILIAGLEVAPYMVWTSSHDGKGSAQAFPTDVQVVCENTLQMAKMAAKYKYTIRHTKNAAIRLQDAREAIKLSFKYDEEWQNIGDTLATQKLDKDSYNTFLKDLVGLDDIDQNKQKKAYSNAIGVIHNIHEIRKNADYIEDYRSTWWGVYQAVTDYTSNVKKYRNPQSRFEKLVNGPALNNRAMELMPV